MKSTKRADGVSVCPKTGRVLEPKRRSRWLLWAFPILGLLSLVWFLIRVLPKPSRVAYPCQRVAAPLAGGFVVWIGSLIASAFAYRQTKHLFKQSRLVLAGICLAITVVMGVVSLIHMPEEPALADPPTANQPSGQAKGVNPGRVAWVHDPAATSWTSGVGHWWEPAYTDQAVVDTMMERAVCGLVGTPDVHQAWNKIFEYFNLGHGKGEVGYTPGEKIMIKVNLVGFIAWYDSWDTVSDTTWNINSNQDYMNASPQMMLALLKQLVTVAGVSQQDITIGDTLCNFPNEYYNMLHSVLPNVHYLDYEANLPACPGRTAVNKNSGVSIYWSGPGGNSEQVPTCFTDADYMINMANLKSHDSNGGITVCAKNLYGSLKRGPTNLAPQSGYFDLHASLPIAVPGYGHYRALVDLMGHAKLGGNTLLYLVDGLYAGRHPYESAPRKWDTCPPYDTDPGGLGPDWTSCILASQDPVAIDSVAYDMLRQEWPEAAGAGMSGADDYLVEAAQADGPPPSGTFYDPDHSGDVSRLPSLGVHEHWNNAYDKRYSKNLGYENGIELAALTDQEMLTVKPAGVITIDGDPSDWHLGEFGTLSRGGQGEIGDIGAVGWIDGTFYAGAVSDRVEWGFTYALPDNAQDHAVRFYSRHDAAYQYFLVRSDDDIIWTSRSYNFENDCCEFFFDPGRYRSTTPMWGSTDSSGPFELVIDAKNERSVAETSTAYRDQILSGVESAVSVDATGWWLEMRIAKNVTDPPLPASGTFGLNINFRDQDADLGYPSLYGWTNDYAVPYPTSTRFPDKTPYNFGNVYNGYQVFADPPRLAALSGPQQVVEGEEYTKQLILLEGAPPVTWSLVQGPQGLQITQTGLVYGWVAETPGTSVTIEVQVQNAFGTDTLMWNACVLSTCARCDFDVDGDVDQGDYGHLQSCMSGPGVPITDPACLNADADGDGDVDDGDLNTFKFCLSGAKVPVSPPCPE